MPGGEVRVAVVGGGQAGLATSYWLGQQDVEHVVLDRGETGDSWRARWDSFCLVTPNWTLRLPDFPYDGPEPDGFLPRDDIVNYLEGYRRHLDPPLHRGVEVTRVTPVRDHWVLVTPGGVWEAGSVVIATGPFQVPSVPAPASLAPGVLQLHSHDYRRPEDLPAGAVLVVGSAQSGCQIVDDLRQAGREVWLSVGRAERAPRRYRGYDIVWWMREIGLLEKPVADLPAGEEVRFRGNAHVSGRDGGKELNLRAFGRDGVRLLGRFLGAEGIMMHFAGDLRERLEDADRGSREIEQGIDEFISHTGIEAPSDDREPIEWEPPDVHEEMDLAAEGISSVIWATGYRLDFSWIDAPVFGRRGYPNQVRGLTGAPGLYFVGLAAMHTLGSGLFWGVGSDAEHVVRHITDSGSPDRSRPALAAT